MQLRNIDVIMRLYDIHIYLYRSIRSIGLNCVKGDIFNQHIFVM